MSLESLDLREVESAIEGILFASGEPLPIDRICLALDLDRPTAEQVLQKLGDYYAFERRGIRLVRMEDSYQLCSSPDYADVIRKAFEIRKTAKLSQPALEVLTIIAYYQPTTRAYVDQIRGVDSAYTSPRPAPTLIRCAAWTARTPWACCLSAGSLRSADVCRCRDGRGCTARRKSSCATSTWVRSRSCRRCRVLRPTVSSA